MVRDLYEYVRVWVLSMCVCGYLPCQKKKYQYWYYLINMIMKKIWVETSHKLQSLKVLLWVHLNVDQLRGPCKVFSLPPAQHAFFFLIWHPN